MTEGDFAGSQAAELEVGGATVDVEGGCDGVFEEGGGLGFGRWWTEMYRGAENLGDVLMGPFEDTVGGRRMRGGGSGADAGGNEEFLKFFFELGAVVLYATNGLRVTGKPVSADEASGFFGRGV